MRSIQMARRPKNLNLFTIRLPVNAMVSIMHRMSGVVLFLLLPLMLWLMKTATESEESFSYLAHLTDSNWAKLILIGLSIPFFHHFYAGLRHLGQDVHWMKSLQKARFSSRVVLCLVGLSVILFGISIW